MESYHVYQMKVEHSGFINYAYIIVDDATQKAAVVDPSWDYDAVVRVLKKLNVQAEMILLTHLHPDHAFCAHRFPKDFPDCRIYLSRQEYEYYGYAAEGLQLFEDDAVQMLGGTSIRCLVTPGHTKGSACYLLHGELFAGDTVFAEGCGICSCAGGDAEAMYRSFQRLKQTVRQDVRVYAAHSFGYVQGKTMAELMRCNIYFQFETMESFVRMRNRKGQKNLFAFQ